MEGSEKVSDFFDECSLFRAIRRKTRSGTVPYPVCIHL